MVEIRPITEDEVVPFREAMSIGFGSSDPTDPDAVGRFLELFPLETTLAAFDHGRIVATFSSFDLDLAVPGGSVPMAGTTVVTVSPTHTRRGILTEMMARHLRQAIERHQPVAGLWASEERIYGRFGYGQAAAGYELKLPAATVSVPPGPADISVRLVSVEEARTELPPIHRRAVACTPGSFPRSDAWWEQRHLLDLEHRRPAGMTPRRHVLAERDGSPVGYAGYRQRAEWTSEAPAGVVSIVELVADDDDARRALWHFLTTVDLFPNVEWWNAPVDDPVLIEVDRVRSLTLNWSDSLWVRPLDVAVALEARTYERDGALTIGVADSFLDRGGSFRLEVDDGVGRCKPTTIAPDVQLGIADLGALFLGGRSATVLARAGRLSGDTPAVRALDDLFRTSIAPYCMEVF